MHVALSCGLIRAKQYVQPIVWIVSKTSRSYRTSRFTSNLAPVPGIYDYFISLKNAVVGMVNVTLKLQ